MMDEVTGLEFAGLENDGLENDGLEKKVKASHTRYRALGSELIPVCRQSARR